MPKSYSEDLRKSAISLYDKIKDMDEVAAIYSVAKSTIYNWRNQLKEVGHLASKIPNVQPRKIDNATLILIKRANPDFTQEEIGKIMDVTSSAIGYALRRLGFYKKKDYNLQRSRSKKTGDIFGQN